MPQSERTRPARLEALQYLDWILTWQEQAPPPKSALLLLPAPQALLLLAAGPPIPEVPASPGEEATESLSCIAKAALALAANPACEETPFVDRLMRLRPRIEQLIRRRWYEEYDTYELDNLVQAGMVHLWEAYQRAPALFDERGDGYWYTTAICGARYEIIHEYKQRYREQGSGSTRERRRVEVVVSAGDLLAHRAADGQTDEFDEALLSSETIYHHDTADIQEADQRMEVPRLEALIYSGTNPVDHPRITTILDYMRQGMSILDMARHEGVPPTTVHGIIRRMQQACGVSAEARHNRTRPGNSLDEKICALRDRGLAGPEIARLIGRNPSFVYRRLRAMQPTL